MHPCKQFHRVRGNHQLGRFPQGCEGTVTRSRLLDKGGGGLLCSTFWLPPVLCLCVVCNSEGLMLSQDWAAAC